MKKLNGGHLLSCGHQQVVSNYRVRLASEGREQHSVWCMECEDWAELAPFEITTVGEDDEQESESDI